MSSLEPDDPDGCSTAPPPCFYRPTPVVDGLIAEAGSAALHNQRAVLANIELTHGNAAINQLGSRFAKVGEGSLAGRVAEQAHASTFNADAIMQGRPEITARATASNGGYHDVADIHILEHGGEVARAQVKYCGIADQTAVGLAHPKYGGQKLVAPSDQLDGVHSSYRRRIARESVKRPQRAADYSSAQSRTSSVLEHKGVKSTPLSAKDARRLAGAAKRQQARFAKIPSKPVAPSLLEASGRAALEGAAVAGGLSVIVSGFQNGRAYFKGEKQLGEAARDTAVNTGLALLDSGAKAVMGSALKGGATVLASTSAKSAIRSVAQSAARSNVLSAAGTVLIDAGVGGIHLARGKLSIAEYGKRLVPPRSSP